MDLLKKYFPNLVEGDERQGWNPEPGSDGEREAVAGGNPRGGRVEEAETCQGVTLEVKPDVVFAAQALDIDGIQTLKNISNTNRVKTEKNAFHSSNWILF